MGAAPVAPANKVAASRAARRISAQRGKHEIPLGGKRRPRVLGGGGPPLSVSVVRGCPRGADPDTSEGRRPDQDGSSRRATAGAAFSRGRPDSGAPQACARSSAGSGSCPGSHLSALRLFRRRRDADVQLAQLLFRDRPRSVHHEVLRLLVHGEGHDLADVRLIGDEHDHAVHARRDAAVGRGSQLEGVDHGRRSRGPPLRGRSRRSRRPCT